MANYAKPADWASKKLPVPDASDTPHEVTEDADIGLDPQLALLAVDPVNHPPHYTAHPSGIECIEIIRHMGFNLGNAIKYIWRADLKGGVEDLEKAIWYLKDEIGRLTGGAERP